MSKRDKLREKLFAKYFEVDEGINVIKLVEYLKPVRSTWKKLHALLEKNMDDFYMGDRIEDIKVLDYNNRHVLFIKLSIWYYLTVDIENQEILSDEIIDNFDEDFFALNFGEKGNKEYYHFVTDFKDVSELVDFERENGELLYLPKRIFYKIIIGDAYTYLNISLGYGSTYMTFETSDQFLYDQLFLTPDLEPLGMQDATKSIGEKRMKEIFEEIRAIKIPKNVIPHEFFENGLIPPEPGKRLIYKG